MKLNMWSHRLWVRRDCSNKSIVFSLDSFFSSHSHMVMTRHPDEISATTSWESRFLFLIIFWYQKAVLDFGITKSLQPSWPCQKQPFTKIAVLYLGSTISGLPGSSFTWSRYRNPRFHKAWRTSSSGFVLIDRICDIQLCRCWDVILSAMGLIVFLWAYSNRQRTF